MIESNDETYDIYQKFEKSEIALHKLQLENAKKNSEIIKLKEELKHYKTNIANSSASFPWPEEFKCKWETLFKTIIMDSFENTSLNPILFMKEINIIIKIIYEIAKIKIKEKVLELLKCLNIKVKSEDMIKKFFYKYQKILFQNYFNSLFIINDELVTRIIVQIKNEFYSMKYQKFFSKEEISNIMIDLTPKNISTFIKELYYLCLYMNINIPTLTIKTSINTNYRYFNKNEYTNLEGFGNDGDICLIIINPPMVKENIPFRGIKPVVFIIDNPSKEIIKMCEQQKISKTRREQSKSFSGINNTKLPFQQKNKINNNSQQNNKNNINQNKFSQKINGFTSNDNSTNDATSNRDVNSFANNFNNSLLENKFNNDFSNQKPKINNKIINNNNNTKLVSNTNTKDIKQINKLSNINKNEYKSKSINKEIQNNINYKKKEDNNKFNEYSNIIYNDKKKNKKIKNIKNKYLYNEIYKDNDDNQIKIYNNNFNKVNNNEYKQRVNHNNDDQNNNCNQKIDYYIYKIDSNDIAKKSNKKINCIDINNNSKLKERLIHNLSNEKILTHYLNSEIDYEINSNDVINKRNNNPLMNSLKESSNFLKLKIKQNISNNILIEKSRNTNIKLENKEDFKINIMNHNNLKNKKERYSLYNKSINNANNKIIITTSDYSKQNILNNNISNINTNSNESYLLSAKKKLINKHYTLNNSNFYKNDCRAITPLQIIDNPKNQMINVKYNINMRQLTDNLANDNKLNNNQSLAKTTIKKISSNNNYNFKKLIENNKYINNKNINNNINENNEINFRKTYRIKNISPDDKNMDQKSCSYLNYNLNNNKILNENNNTYYFFQNKNKHRTKSNDHNIKRKNYLKNLSENNFIKEDQDKKMNSNKNILNKDFSSSSILSNNSQIMINKNKGRDSYSNLNNNVYNDHSQLKTEISERSKGSYFNYKNSMYLINNNYINNKNISNKYEFNNSSNRNNIHYTKNTKYIESKNLNFQLNYESNRKI